MNLYIVEYYWSGRYGAYDSIIYLIFAETDNVALGLALEHISKDLEEPNVRQNIEDFDIKLFLPNCPETYESQVTKIHQESS